MQSSFQFNAEISRLVAELCRIIPEFESIDLSKVLISASHARGNQRSGVLAYVLPLRFREGSPVETRVRGTKAYHFAMLPYLHEGREILYIIYFMLPRFLNLGWRDKLETVIHELYHINPVCNGDLRRLKGRSRMHGNSLKEYDAGIKAMVDRVLRSGADFSAYDFLFYSHREMEKKWGEVIAHKIREPRPKLIKVASLDSSPS